MKEALIAAGLESPYEEWLKEWDGEDTVTPRITTRVECAEWFPRRDEALLAHATQIDPTSRWFAVPLPLRRHRHTHPPAQPLVRGAAAAAPADRAHRGLRAGAVPRRHRPAGGRPVRRRPGDNQRMSTTLVAAAAGNRAARPTRPGRV